MKKLLLTNLLTLAGAACAVAQTDVTYKIANPNFEENGTDGWTCTNLSPQSNNSFTKKSGKVYLEKWVSSGGTAGSASLKQTVKNLPKGTYRLTVAAQNIQQNDTKKQTGAFIYAKSATTKQEVTDAADYTLDFSISTSTVAIGFTATNATGNWICCDNFRLTFLSTDAENVNSLIESAKGQLEKKLNDAHLNTLKKAIADAEEAVKNNVEDLTPAANSLQDAYADAQANTKAYSTLASLVIKANIIAERKMSNADSEALKNAIAAADEAQNTTDNDPVKLAETLQAAYDKANASISAYRNLNTAVTKAETSLDETKNDADKYAAVVDAASKMYEQGTATNDEINEQIEMLTKALLLFNLANATPGEGAAPQVTETNRYVVTGSTEALMRATFKGDNILEKGVCWSTEHNPTILDGRTQKSFSLNGTIIHVKGLESGTVYYLRPYVMNKTYTVAYGEEVKIVTHPKGTCVGSWDGGAPSEDANTRCRNAIDETIEYFNQWTGIKGFHLSGHYGAQTPTADCSYGGWMRIGPNAGNQAIGTVIHETGHGVGVGTHDRWWDTNVHDWVWKGREANDIYHFLENSDEYVMVGDKTHGWGDHASFDWFVNGADKDKHNELQYIGGCALLYGLFIDGLCPTSSYSNGLAGYTYNYDDRKNYYIMCKSAERGLGDGLLYQRNSTSVAWKPFLTAGETIDESAAWKMEYDAQTGYYSFRNASTGKYLTHESTSISAKTITKSPSNGEKFQIMPDRTDVEINTLDNTGKHKTHGYWFTWNNSGNKAMAANKMTDTGYGTITTVAFNFADTATQQQWIILSEDDIMALGANVVTDIKDATTEADNISKNVTGIYTASGIKVEKMQPGLNIIKYSDGTTKKIIK